MATTVAQHAVATFSSPVNGTTPIDANTVRGNDNTIRTSYNDHDADTGIHVQSSTLASRPAAGTAGRKWITSGDGGDYHLWFDDGTKWVLVGDQTTQVQVRAAASLTAGQVVKLTGYNTTDKVPEVNVVASAADTAFGLVEVAISSGAIGYVTVMGVVTSVVNTSSFSALDQLYQNGSAGFTATKPTSGVYQPCAVVLRSDASAGSIYVEFMATRIVERTDNTANTIVLRDGSGAFTTGAITSAGLITFASLKGTGATTVTTILDEDNMATDSATALATQQSIKAYVDTKVTAEDLDFAGGSGTGSVDLDSQTFTIAGTSNEIVTVAGSQTLTISLPDDVTIGNDLTVTRHLDVDGTANLDAVDIDGAVQVDAAVTVGVDDTGYDVKFFGDTASAYMLWDTSADDLILAGAAGLDVDGVTNLDVVDIDGAVDMASTLQVDGAITGSSTIQGTTITATTALVGTLSTAAQTNITSVGALNAGSITSGFGAIDVGSSAISGGAGTLSSLSVGDGNITNVGDIALDSISSDGSAIAIGGTGDTVTCNGAWIFNESSADVDFRIEGNGEANLFFVDAGNDRIGINTNAPTAKLHLLQSAADFDSGIKLVGSDSVISGRIWMGGGHLNIDNATAGTGTGLTLEDDGTLTYGGDFLDVADGVTTIGGTDTSKLQFNNAAGTLRSFLTLNSTSLEIDTDSAIIFSANNSERARIDDSGRLGLGTSAPHGYYSGSNKFVIANTGGSTGMTFATSNTGQARIDFAEGTSGAEQYRGTISYNHAATESEGYLRFVAGGAEALRLGSNYVLMANLPTSDPSVANSLYNDSGTLKISAG